MLEERYASLAFCTPTCVAGSGPCSPICTGPECAQQLVTGAPDSRSVALGSRDCQVLDIVFNGGNIVPRAYTPDLVIHTSALDPSVRVRVEASRTGKEFEVVAWINGIPHTTTSGDRCSGRHEGDRIVIDLSAGENNAGCTYVETVSHLRLSIDAAQLVGNEARIDAFEVEPCSFRKHGAPLDTNCASTIRNTDPGRGVDETGASASLTSTSYDTAGPGF
jgi:hypothetical protein